MLEHTRRDFFQVAGLSLLAGTFLSSCKGKSETAPMKKANGFARLNFGMASYTFRKFNLDDTLAMTNRLGLKKIALKSYHLPLDASQEEIKQVAQKVRDAGIELYGAGVIYMKNKDQVNQAFDYARAAGIKVIIGVPEHDLLNMVNDKVKEYDIKVAIHNHGPGDKRYPSPQSVYEKVKDLDSRIGLCMDVGHTQRIGVDPSQAAKQYADRLLDIHIKDVTAANKDGKTIEIGRGIIDIPKFLNTLMAINYAGVVSLEFEKDAEDPLPGCAESVGYLRGVMSVI